MLSYTSIEIMRLVLNRHLLIKDIVNQLKGLWDPSGNNGKLAMQTKINAKIGDSIKDNKRIYVFLHSNLRNNTHEQFLFHQDIIGYTWVPSEWYALNNCRHLATEISDNCPREARRKFVRLDLNSPSDCHLDCFDAQYLIDFPFDWMFYHLDWIWNAFRT